MNVNQTVVVVAVAVVVAAVVEVVAEAEVQAVMEAIVIDFNKYKYLYRLNFFNIKYTIHVYLLYNYNL